MHSPHARGALPPPKSSPNSQLRSARRATTLPVKGEPMEEDRLSFKEMCAKFDVTPRTLRYYEYIELLAPEKEGRARFYTPREVARMTLIMRGRRFGFSLEEVRQWLLIYDEEGTEAQLRAWVEMADRQLEKLDAQINELVEARDDLETLRRDGAKALGE
jgi:DNA-binding transcriptional MerR regulator